MRIVQNQIPLLSIGAGALVVIWTVTTVAIRVSDATRQGAATRAAVARSLAEELAVTVTIDGGGGFSRHGFTATGRRVDREGRSDLELSIVDDTGVLRSYRADVLPGAAPVALGTPLSIVTPTEAIDPARDAAWTWLSGPGVPEPTWLPRKPRIVVPARTSAAEECGFVRNTAIALLRLRAGTDQEDFVLVGEAGEPRRPRVPTAGVVVVPGNLWLTDASGSLEIAIEDPLTVIVEGNLYVDAGVRVVGRGDLAIVVREVPGSTFVDRDRDGRFSAADRIPGSDVYRGFLEGSGSVHFGLPGAGPGGTLGFDPSLVVHRDAFVRRTRVDLHGSVTLCHGLLREDERQSVRFTGRRLLDVHRRRLPGFAVHGSPRPGLLEPVAAGAFSNLAPSIPEGPR